MQFRNIQLNTADASDKETVLIIEWLQNALYILDNVLRIKLIRKPLSLILQSNNIYTSKTANPRFLYTGNFVSIITKY